MSGSALAAWCGLTAVLTVTPGVDMALVTRTALSGGRSAAFAATGGILSGLLVWGAASAVGVAAVLAASATAYDALRLAGAAYLVWLGLGAWRRAGRTHPDGDEPRPRTGRSAYGVGLVSNLANPKIVVLYSTVMPGFIAPGAPVLRWSLALAGIHAAMCLLWLSAYAWLLSRARAAMERPPVRRALDRLSGTVLVALGLRLALERR